MYDPWYDDNQYPSQYQPQPGRGYRSSRNRRSSATQAIPVIVLVVVLIGGVIGVARFLSSRSGSNALDQQSQQAPQQSQPSRNPPATTSGQDGGDPTQDPIAGGGATGTTSAGGGAGGTRANLVSNGQFEDDKGLDGWDQVDAVAQRVQPGWKSARGVYVQPEPGAPAGRFARLLSRGVARDARGSTVVAAAWVRVPKTGIQVRIGLEEQGRTGDTVTIPIRDGDWHLVAVEHQVRTSGAVDLSVGTVGAPAGTGVVVDAVSAKLQKSTD
jgi:hypothetical protein